MSREDWKDLAWVTAGTMGLVGSILAIGKFGFDATVEPTWLHMTSGIIGGFIAGRIGR